MTKNPATKNNSTVKIARPFLKWAGGKGQLLKKFSEFYPAELKQGQITNYYEPFLGGGAVFFDIVNRFKIERAFLFDINEDLILTYKVVQKEPERLIKQLRQFRDLYIAMDDGQQKDFFYSTRDKFNQNAKKLDRNKFSPTWTERAAQIIFLNKTCFNGLFRFNSKGEFNVPAGRYKNPKILDEKNLLNASKSLQIAEIEITDFKTVETAVKKNSFVYFDPPYRPLSKTASFTSYSKNNFGDREQKELAAMFSRLDQKNVPLMLSNSDPKNTDPDDHFFDDLYKNFNIFRIPAKRAINSKASLRQNINEVLVTNYPVTT